MQTLAEDIADLQFYPEWLDEIVNWHHQEWLCQASPSELTATNIARALAERRQTLHQHLLSQTIPSTFLAMTGKKAVGTVSLVYFPLTSQATERVWLTNLYVLPTHRRNGLGSRLLAYAETFARAQGLPELYLYTLAANDFYKRNDWVYQYRAQLPSYSVAVLKKQLLRER